MAVSKVNYGGTTLMDLTGDTVTAETLMNGVTAHAADGAQVTGTFTPAITKIESLDKTNMISLRSIDSGSYILYGYFKPHDGATSTMTFSSDLLVNIVKGTSESHVQVFYPYNNQVQYIKITDTSYERTDIKLNELQKQSIADAGGYFTTKTVEAALQELGSNPKLPTVSASDKGKVLRVSESGSWAAETISNAEEASF